MIGLLEGKMKGRIVGKECIVPLFTFLHQRIAGRTGHSTLVVLVSAHQDVALASPALTPAAETHNISLYDVYICIYIYIDRNTVEEE